MPNGWTFFVRKEIRYLKGSDALARERALHSEYAWCAYSGDTLLKSGNSELFTVDIFAMLESTANQKAA